VVDLSALRKGYGKTTKLETKRQRVSMYPLNRSVRIWALASFLVVTASGFADAACYSSQQVLPAKTIAQFTSHSTQLLSDYPIGGGRMISMVRDLIASDPATLPLVLDLSAHGNPDQINAIGTGLGQAALVCSRIDQLFANEIQQMVAASNNRSLVLAFTEVLGDQQISDAGGGGGGGGGGGPTGNNGIFGGFVGSSGQLNLTTSAKTKPTNFFTLSFTATGSDPAIGGTSKPISVSPSQ
jgi:hypothetical protein